MTERKDFLELIKCIEEEFHVNSLICNGIRVWPIIRFELFKLVIKSQEMSAPQLVDINRLQQEELFLNQAFLKQLDSFQSNTNKTQFAFFEINNSPIINLQEKQYNKFMDSICSLLSHNGYSSSIFTIFEKEDFLKNKENRLQINDLYKLNYIQALLLYSQKCNKVDNLEGFVKYLVKEKKLNVNYEFLLFSISLVFTISNNIKKLLSYVKPQGIFLLPFYSSFSFGVMLAANELNINTIDLQHGIQNDYHYMYTSWTQIPKNGYELLPNYFFMWSPISQKRILNWSNRSLSHDALVVGNPFFMKKELFSLENKELNKIFDPKKVHILVSMQDGIDTYKDILLESIEQSDEKIVWHFKKHPKMPESVIFKELELNKKLLNRIEYKIINKYTIYDIMKYIDINITLFSTVAYELRDYCSIPTIFIRDIKDSLDDELFFYGDKTDEILLLIRKLIKNSSKNKSYKEKYILSDKNLFINGIKNIG